MDINKNLKRQLTKESLNHKYSFAHASYIHICMGNNLSQVIICTLETKCASNIKLHDIYYGIYISIYIYMMFIMVYKSAWCLLRQVLI